MQNLLKSVFIAVFPVTALLVVVYYSRQLIQINSNLITLGMILTSLPIVAFYVGLFLKPVARTKPNLNFYTVGITIGFVISLIGNSIDLNSQALVLATVLFVGWILYLKWYSVFNSRINKVLQVGNTFPNVTFENSEKEPISVSSFLGKPTIYLFYRGNWCPLCMAQIKEVVEQYKILEERGVQTVFVSPQPHKFSETLSKKHGLQFQFLTDTHSAVAKQLGILSKNGIPLGFQAFGYDSDTVLPTVVITDSEGVIKFVDLTDNYRVRPEPDFFMEYV